MPALVRVSGPVHHFIQFYGNGGAQTPVYLGTAEKTPEYEEHPRYVAVMNSLAGSTLAFDETWDGSNMIIKTTLTRYDQVVYQALRNAPFAPGYDANGQLGVVGQETNLSRGTLMYNRFPRLILANSFFGTPNAKPDDFAGYLFYSAKYNAGIPGQGGTNANSLGLVFECMNVFQTNAPNKFGFACFSTTDPIITQALAVVN